MDNDHQLNLTVRRVTIPVIGLVVFSVGLLRLLAFQNIARLEPWQEMGKSVLDNILAASVVSLFAGVTILYLTRDQGRPQPALLKNRSLKKALERDAATSSIWRIRARTGSYFVRETLPIIVKDRNAKVHILLMDPSRTQDLTTYEELRDAQERENWRPERIRADIIVSVIRIIQYRNLHPRLEIHLAVTSAGWVQSLDISTRNVFLCGQQKGDSALVIPHGHELFDRFLDDFGAAESLAKKLHALPRIPGDRDLGSPDEPISADTILALRDYLLENLSVDVMEPSNGIQSAVIQRSTQGHHYV